MLGTSYTRRGYRFTAYVVQEENFRYGLHAHLILGYDNTQLKRFNPPSFEDVWVRTWCQLGRGRHPCAQDVQAVRTERDLDRTVAYINKDILHAERLDRLDVANICIS